MLRVAFILLALLLTGCASWFKPKTSMEPVAPTPTDVVNVAGLSQDKLDAKVSAAIAEAREQNKTHTNFDKVEAELSVAASMLPKPDEAEKALAHARAERFDPAEYAKAIQIGMDLQKKVDDAWAKMEAAQREAQRLSEIKDKEIAQLKKDVDDAKREAARNLYSMAAVGLMVFGAIAVAVGRLIAGSSLLFCGLVIGTVPFILATPWFVPGVASLAIIAFILVGWHVLNSKKESNAKTPAIVEKV